MMKKMDPISQWTKILRLVEKRHSIAISVLTLPELRNESFRLRYEVYNAWGYLDADEMKTSMLTDKWDENSIILGAINNENKIIGTVRLTQVMPYGLPSDQLFNTTYPFEITQALEINKFAVSKIFSKNRVVTFALTLKAAIITRQKGYPYWVMSTTTGLKKSFEKLGSTIYEIPSSLKPLDEIKKVCSNWKMFVINDERYYYLETSKISPKLFNHKKTFI